MLPSVKTNISLISHQNKITQKITRFWDQISPAWQQIWGPHIHHGYYHNNADISPLTAQEQLIEKLAAYLILSKSTKLLDVGCGMGGSSIYLAKKFEVQAIGITLSPKQVELATAHARHENFVNNQPVFQVEDALTMTHLDNNSFDVVWSLESCEQFFDKDAFMKQAYRVLKPGGVLMLATWCSSQEEYTGHDAGKYKKLCKAFDLPYMPSLKYYNELLKANGFEMSVAEDWSRYVEKSWEIGVSLAGTYNFIQILKMAGWRGFRFAKQIKLMRNAFRDKKVRYGVFIASKGL